MKKDYTEFDAALLAHIKAGKNKAMNLEYQGDIIRLAAPHASTSSPVFRVVDRRLQALRRAGKIRFNGKHWELTK